MGVGVCLGVRRHLHLHPEHTPTPSRRYPLYWCILSKKDILKVLGVFSQLAYTNILDVEKNKNLKKNTQFVGVLGVFISLNTPCFGCIFFHK